MDLGVLPPLLSAPQHDQETEMEECTKVESLDTHLLLKTLIAFKKGDFSVRLPVTEVGIAGKIADTLNEIFELNDNLANELDRISNVVGKEGKITQRASL